MATRTIKVYGHAYADSGNVTVVCSWNGSQVFSGTVNTTIGDPPENSVDPELAEAWMAGDPLFTFDTTTDVTGFIPVQFTVTGGTLLWQDMLGNYVPYRGTDPIPDPYDPSTFFGELNSNTLTSDGKVNVAVVPNPSGMIYETPGDEPAGEFIWTITDGATLNGDFYVDEHLTFLG